jgi:ATP-dependent DNA helicase RecG
VSSPGGFVEGINSGNIITHPSRSRHGALTALLAALRVAEREGIGVDRMVRDMIRVGLAPPLVEKVDGPMVRTALSWSAEGVVAPGRAGRAGRGFFYVPVPGR